VEEIVMKQYLLIIVGVVAFVGGGVSQGQPSKREPDKEQSSGPHQQSESPPEKSSISSGVLSPDGRMVAASESDGTIRLYDSDSRQVRVVLKAGRNPVNSMAFSPDCQLIVTASRDGFGRLWNTITGKQVAVLKGHIAAIHSATFSANGQLIATGGGDGVRLWSSPRGKLINKITSAFTTIVAFSPDGSKLLADQGETVEIWDLSTALTRDVSQPKRGSVLLLGPFFGPRSTFFTPDGVGVTVTFSTGTKCTWSASTGNLISGPCRKTNGIE
jgi:WD40 repeat protein